MALENFNYLSSTMMIKKKKESRRTLSSSFLIIYKIIGSNKFLILRKLRIREDTYNLREPIRFKDAFKRH